MEAMSGFMKQVLCDGQIYSSRIGIDMTEERGEAHQLAVGIDALSIPAKQCGHCERVPQIMESR
jgi:hypothetical protein